MIRYVNNRCRWLWVMAYVTATNWCFLLRFPEKMIIIHIIQRIILATFKTIYFVLLNLPPHIKWTSKLICSSPYLWSFQVENGIGSYVIKRYILLTYLAGTERLPAMITFPENTYWGIQKSNYNRSIYLWRIDDSYKWLNELSGRAVRW